MSARPDQINRPVMYRYLLPLFAEGQSAEVKTKSMFAEHTHTQIVISQTPCSSTSSSLGRSSLTGDICSNSHGCESKPGYFRLTYLGGLSLDGRLVGLLVERPIQKTSPSCLPRVFWHAVFYCFSDQFQPCLGKSHTLGLFREADDRLINLFTEETKRLESKPEHKQERFDFLYKPKGLRVLVRFPSNPELHKTPFAFEGSQQ